MLQIEKVESIVLYFIMELLMTPTPLVEHALES